jgi:hypothetical protein
MSDRLSEGISLAATYREAMRLTDTVAQISVGPAGVAERRVGRQPADQTPAGGGGKHAAQVMLRIRSVVGMTFSPEGSLLRNLNSRGLIREREGRQEVQHDDFG